jgi:quinoprotein glucose dehydrogenase
MTYEAGGRQYVAIAAGGSGPFGTGDAIMAFALPER